jgi:hypothetical protein
MTVTGLGRGHPVDFRLLTVAILLAQPTVKKPSEYTLTL